MLTSTLRMQQVVYCGLYNTLEGTVTVPRQRAIRVIEGRTRTLLQLRGNPLRHPILHEGKPKSNFRRGIHAFPPLLGDFFTLEGDQFVGA